MDRTNDIRELHDLDLASVSAGMDGFKQFKEGNNSANASGNTVTNNNKNSVIDAGGVGKQVSNLNPFKKGGMFG